MRLDVYLTENKICKSRAAAQSLIKNGGVTLNGKAVTKNSIEVSENDIVSVIEQKQLKYVCVVFPLDLQARRLFYIAHLLVLYIRF